MQFTLSLGYCPTDHYLPLARAAEEAGWDSIAVPDELFYFEQVSVPYPYTRDGSRFWQPETPFLEPFVLISMMAAVTARIRFYPAVLKLAVREPLLVAKELSSCAVLSGERVALGVGLGPWPEDFEVLGQEWGNRGPRSAEMIEIIRGLLRGGMFEFEGSFYRVPRLQISPVPSRAVPIYVGGLAEPVLKRAARLGDGYIGWENPRCVLDEVPALVGRLAAYRRDYDRANQPFEIKFMPRSCDREVVRRLGDCGVTDVICTPWSETHGHAATLEERIEALRRFAGDIVSGFR